MMTTKEVLIKARELLSSHQRWTKGFYAKDNKGNHVYYLGNEACRFCLSGAIKRVCGMSPSYELTTDIDKQLKNNMKRKRQVFEFNDTKKTHYKDVIELLDKTIKSL